MKTPTIFAGIAASGRGSRLGDSSKALTEVAGRPMIDHVLEQFLRAGIRHVVATVRPEDRALKRHLERWRIREFRSVCILEVSSAAGSGGATRALTDAIGPRAHLLSTVDFIGPHGLAAQLVRESALRYTPAAVMLATPLQRDSKPAWIDIDSCGRVRRFGRDLAPTSYVYGNMRWMSAEAAQTLRRLPAITAVERDSVLVNRLIAATARPVEALVTSVVFDIDDAVDLHMAESWLTRRGKGDWDSRSRSPLDSAPGYTPVAAQEVGA